MELGSKALILDSDEWLSLFPSNWHYESINGNHITRTLSPAEQLMDFLPQNYSFFRLLEYGPSSTSLCSIQSFCLKQTTPEFVVGKSLATHLCNRPGKYIFNPFRAQFLDIHWVNSDVPGGVIKPQLALIEHTKYAVKFKSKCASAKRLYLRGGGPFVTIDLDGDEAMLSRHNALTNVTISVCVSTSYSVQPGTIISVDDYAWEHSGAEHFWKKNGDKLTPLWHCVEQHAMRLNGTNLPICWARGTPAQTQSWSTWSFIVNICSRMGPASKLSSDSAWYKMMRDGVVLLAWEMNRDQLFVDPQSRR